MKFALTVLAFTFLSSSIAQGGERGFVVLRAFIAPTINTTIDQTQLSLTSSRVTLKSEINSKYLREEQKFEVEGLDQEGLESELKLVAGNGRTIQYELLVTHLQRTMPAKPIFLKITAN